MDGQPPDLESVPAVASDGTSSVVNGSGTDIPPGKQSTLDRALQHEESAFEAGMCVGFSKSPSSGLKKDLQKCATFPSSAAAEAQQENSYRDAAAEAQQENSYCDADNAATDAHTYQRSVSLPPTVKLISAIKGSRQKNGIPLPTEDRHIKWAADVYDPPVSSVSHSMNNSYQRRPKPRKKDKTKQKEKRKARSKKKANNAAQNQAVLQTPGLEDLGTSIDMEALADPGKLETEILDYGISSQEAKCGSSFLLETVAKMHFSTAEAS